MALSIKIDRQRRLIISTFTGTFSPERLHQGRMALREDPAFDPSYALIIDLSRVSKVEFSKPALEQMARDRSLLKKTSLQVIVAPDRLKFEFAKMFKAKSSKERPALQVTRTLEAALAAVALYRVPQAKHAVAKPGS